MAQNIVVTQIDGVPYTTRPIAICSTAAATAAKIVECDGFSLMEGATLIIMFVNGNTASNPTLNVNGTGARRLYNGSGYSQPNELKPYVFYEVMYEGQYWQILGSAQDHYRNTVSTQNGTDTSGTEITIPVITTNSYGHVTKVGTHKHTVAVQKISKFCTIAGGQNKDKYFYIGSVLCDQAWSGYHANLSFVGAEAAWSGILYFGFRLGSGLTSFSGVDLKWLSLTRSDVSDKIIMTYTDESEGRRIHLFFKYPADYLATSISIISEGESSPKPFIFNGAVSSSLIGTVYKTSSIDSNSSSSSHFQYGVELPQGTWAGGFDLSSGNNFIFECDDTVEMGPRQSGDGLYVKLAAEYKQKILNLENYISTLVAENEHQIQQINDLKSTLESIITGKTWDSNIWGGSSETTTQSGDEPSETTPPV